MAKAAAIKALAAFGVFAALWLGDSPTSWWIAGSIVLVAFSLIAWGVFDATSSLWAPTLWRVPGVNAVALTFDDGPDPEFTPRVLEILAREKVTATFFVVGERARANQDLLREIDRRGHLIGNHSFSHAWNINFALHAGLTREICRCNEAIEAAIGKRPQYYRAPHGFKNPALGDVLAKHAMTCVAERPLPGQSDSPRRLDSGFGHLRRRSLAGRQFPRARALAREIHRLGFRFNPRSFTVLRKYGMRGPLWQHLDCVAIR